MGQGIETALDVFNFEPIPPENVDAEFRCEPKILNKDVQRVAPVWAIPLSIKISLA
jgi:hypothetical protein